MSLTVDMRYKNVIENYVKKKINFKVLDHAHFLARAAISKIDFISKKKLHKKFYFR